MVIRRAAAARITWLRPLRKVAVRQGSFVHVWCLHMLGPEANAHKARGNAAQKTMALQEPHRPCERGLRGAAENGTDDAVLRQYLQSLCEAHWQLTTALHF